MKLSVRQMVTVASIAAIYFVLCVIFQPISFGPVQVRISECLTILPALSPLGIWGVSIGCLISNILIGGNGILDIIFGTLATVIAAFMTYKLKDRPFLAPLPPVLVNAVIIGAMLSYLFNVSLLSCILWVGLGQIISCYALGLPFLLVLTKYKNTLFPENM